jgi:hypothetical protein
MRDSPTRGLDFDHIRAQPGQDTSAILPLIRQFDCTNAAQERVVSITHRIENSNIALL